VGLHFMAAIDGVWTPLLDMAGCALSLQVVGCNDYTVPNDNGQSASAKHLLPVRPLAAPFRVFDYGIRLTGKDVMISHPLETVGRDSQPHG